MIDADQIQSELQGLQTQRNLQQAKRQASDLIDRLVQELGQQQEKIDSLLFEVQRLKRWRFGKSSESMDANPGQPLDKKTSQVLVQEAQAEDRAADLERKPKDKHKGPGQAKRQALPSQLERIEHHYDIESGLCSQGHRLEPMGQEISEQLDCKPAVFFVHRHIRKKYWGYVTLGG